MKVFISVDMEGISGTGAGGCHSDFLSEYVLLTSLNTDQHKPYLRRKEP